MRALLERMERRPGRVFAAVGLITALLAIPMLTMAPTESASTEPDGPVFEARDEIADRFVSSAYPMFFMAEDPDGDILDAQGVRDLYVAGRALRSELGDTLVRSYDVDLDREVHGVVTVADLAADELGGSILTADDAAVEAAASAVIDRLGPDSRVLNLSTQASRAADGTWSAPALGVTVLADNEQLGLGPASANLGGGTEGERYARDVQAALRSADGIDVYGVAIDVNLTSQDQGALAGPFIGFTVLAVLLIVGLVFRSYWVLAVVGIGLGALVIWLKGLTNLLGFEDDLVLSLIVPIAMISFGVDFAFHAIGRYREERVGGLAPRRAFTVGITAVGSALVLALASDAAAFLSNVTSGIESIVNFGLGAAIALAAAFVLLGVVAPLAVSVIDDRVGRPPDGRVATVVRVGGSLLAGSSVMASVLLMVFVAPWLGVLLYALTVVAVVIVPVAVRSRNADGAGGLEPATTDRLAAPIGGVVSAIASRPRLVLPVALVVTAIAAVFAVQVPAEFDVEDFFSPDSDFVVGLDLLDEHVGERGGEPAQLYVEADLTDPGEVATIRRHVDDLRGLDSEVLARDDAGIVVERGVLAVIDAVWASPVAADLIAAETGVEITDDDGDGVPDSGRQLSALYDVTSSMGVPIDDGRLALTPDDVATSVSLAGGDDATFFEMGLVDSRSQDSIEAAREDLRPVVEAMRADLGSTVELTGSPFVREASLDATSRALRVSLPVAVALCLLIAGVFLRSVRYAIASVLPILMTVAWLYAFMQIAGYAINIVTATIAAVSIGVGIDFAIHFVVRFREELARTLSRPAAIRAAAEGTGTALVASAVSSAVGFGILALAPMPLFAAYGLLTAVMILMAAVATLVVLPSVLVVVAPAADRRPSAPSEVSVRAA